MQLFKMWLVLTIIILATVTSRSTGVVSSGSRPFSLWNVLLPDISRSSPIGEQPSAELAQANPLINKRPYCQHSLLTTNLQHPGSEIERSRAISSKNQALPIGAMMLHRHSAGAAAPGEQVDGMNTTLPQRFSTLTSFVQPFVKSAKKEYFYNFRMVDHWHHNKLPLAPQGLIFIKFCASFVEITENELLGFQVTPGNRFRMEDGNYTAVNLLQARNMDNPPAPLPTDVRIHDDLREDDDVPNDIDLAANRRHGPP